MELPKFMIHQSFRYTLGRMTYAVQVWVNWAVTAWPTLPESTRDLIERELEEKFYYDDRTRTDIANAAKAHKVLPPNVDIKPLGHDCDRAQWQRIRDLYKQTEPPNDNN